MLVFGIQLGISSQEPISTSADGIPKCELIQSPADPPAWIPRVSLAGPILKLEGNSTSLIISENKLNIFGIFLAASFI